MKKTIGIFMAALMLCAAFLCGCGEKEPEQASPYEGKWIGVVAEAMGMQIAVEDAFGGAFEFEVKKGGKVTFTVDDKSGSGKWSADGDKFTLTLQGETMEGTAGENCITFDDMLGTGVKVTFGKDGTDATDPNNYLPEEEKAMLGRWASQTVEELFGEGPVPVADAESDGLVMEFNKDHTVAVKHRGASVGTFGWSVAFGSCLIESDSPSLFVTVNDDGSLDVTYSDGTDYLTYHTVKAEEKAASPAAVAAAPTAQAAAPLTEIQKQWNGWWYGGMEFDNCTGSFESLSDYVFSLAMFVELDAAGEGTLKLYEVQGQVTQDYPDNCFAEVQCFGDGNYLSAVSGTCFGGDIYVNHWRFVHNMKFTDRIEMDSTQKNEDGDELNYFFYLKPWDATWGDDESNLTRRIMGFDEHQAALANGETDIFGNKASAPAASEPVPAASEPAAAAPVSGGTSVSFPYTIVDNEYVKVVALGTGANPYNASWIGFRLELTNKTDKTLAFSSRAEPQQEGAMGGANRCYWNGTKTETHFKEMVNANTVYDLPVLAVDGVTDVSQLVNVTGYIHVTDNSNGDLIGDYPYAF